MQLDADVQLTPCRSAPTTPGPVGLGLGTIDHAEPFQFSISVPDGLPSPFTPRTAPTAQQSEPLTHETSKRPPPCPAGTGGVAARVHVVPFHVSTSGAKVLPEPEPMFSMETPAQALGGVGARRPEQDVVHAGTRRGGHVPARRHGAAPRLGDDADGADDERQQRCSQGQPSGVSNSGPTNVGEVHGGMSRDH